MPIYQMPDGSHADIPEDADPVLLKKLWDSYQTPQVGRDSQSINASLEDKAMAVAKPIDTGLRKGLLFLPTLGFDTGKTIGKLLQKQLGVEPMQGEFADKARAIRDKVDRYLHPEESKDPIGKIAENLIASTSGALIAPGNAVLNAGAGLSGGVGAEAAAKVFGDSPLTRILGSLLGSGVHGFATQEFTNRGKLAREMLDDVDNEDLSKALAKQREARDMKLPIDLSQAMDAPSNIDVYRNTLANMPQGKKVAAMLRQQPADINVAAEDFMHRLPGNLVTKHQSANAFQDNFTAAIGKHYDINTENWPKEFNRVAQITGTHIPENYLKQAYDNIINKAKEFAAKDEKHQQLIALAERLKDNGEWITDGVKLHNTLRDMKSGFKLQGIGNRSVSTETEKYISSVIKDLKDVIGDGFAPMKAADAKYAAYKQNVIDPLKKGVAGRFATKFGATPDREASLAHLKNLFKEGTVKGTKSEILDTADTFKAIGKGQDFADAVKSHFAELISKAGERETNRINPDLPKVLTKLFGSPSDANPTTMGTRDQLIGMARVMNIPDEQHYAEGFRRLMDIVSRTANRPASVSGTSSQAINELAGSGKLDRVGRFSVVSPLRQPLLAFYSLLRKDALKTIDKMITDPDQVGNLILLGKQPEMNPTAQKAITAVLTAGINSKGGQGNE